MESGNKILDKIIALTFTRHAKLSEEDFLKTIESDSATEDEAVRKAKFGLMSAITKELLIVKNKVELMTATFNLSRKEKEDGTN